VRSLARDWAILAGVSSDVRIRQIRRVRSGERRGFMKKKGSNIRTNTERRETAQQIRLDLVAIRRDASERTKKRRADREEQKSK
jgi:hypothetical protein